MFFNADAKDPKEAEKSPIEKEMQEYFLSKRHIFLWGGVDDESVSKVIKQMLFLDFKEKSEITLLINSPGGVISSGLALYDLMQTLESPVSTVVCGQAASMGAVLACAGATGRRYAWKNSRIMIHQPLIHGQFYGPASDVQIQADEMLRVRNNLNEILALHSGKTPAEIERDTDRDYWLSAEDAVKYGLIDHVANKF